MGGGVGCVVLPVPFSGQLPFSSSPGAVFGAQSLPWSLGGGLEKVCVWGEVMLPPNASPPHPFPDLMHSLRLSGPGVAEELLLCLLRVWPTGEYCGLLGTSERTAYLRLNPNTSRPLTAKQLCVLLRWAGALSCSGSTLLFHPVVSALAASRVLSPRALPVGCVRAQECLPAWSAP